jgi:hypothetical protein
MTHHAIEFRPIELHDRNELVLEVDRGELAREGSPEAFLWGEIALVVTCTQTCDSNPWRDSCDRVG